MIKSSWKSLDQRERLALLFLLILSLALRSLYLIELKDTLFLTHLRLDELYHNNWAKSVASGNIIGDEVFFRAPFYPYLLSLFFAIFGHSYIIPRIFQHILGSLSVVVLYLLARKLFGKKAAFISSLIMACYPAVIYTENKFLLESVLLPQLILFFALLYSSKDRPSFYKYLGSGIFFGMIILTRPIFLPLLLIMIIAIAVWHKKSTEWKKISSWALGFTLGTLLMVGIVIIRNYTINKDYTFIASQGGINFYLGNNPSADGFSSTMPGEPGNRWESRDISNPVRENLGREPNISEIDDYWLSQGFRFILGEPLIFAALTLKKIYFFFNAIEIPNNGSFYLYSQFSKVLSWIPVGFWIVGPLSLTGLWIAWREKRGRLLIIFILAYLGLIILFFVCDRFRLPVLPFLSCFAGLAAVRLYEWARSREYQKIKLYGTALLILGFIVNLNFMNFQRGNRAADHFQLGNMELSAGNYSKAISLYRQAENTGAAIQDLYLNWGVAEWRQGNIESALKQFHKEAAFYPASYDAIANLAHLYYLTGNIDKTIWYAQQAIRLKPYSAPAYSDMSLALIDLQRITDAESTLASFLKSYGGDALYEESVLAGIHIVQGKTELAEIEYRSILNRLRYDRQPGYEPEYQYSQEYRIGGSWREFEGKIYYSLGHVFLQRQMYDTAAAYFKRSTELSPQMADSWISLGNSYQIIGRLPEADTALTTGLRLQPENYQAWYNYGLLMEAMSLAGKARNAYTKALRCRPGFDPAAIALTRLSE